MTYFRDSIEAGLRNAASADAASREIDDVFEVLAGDIASASSGKVRLSVSTLPSGYRGSARASDASPQIRPIALQAREDSEREVKVGSVRIDAEGYPVTVVACGHAMTADDAEGLRHALQSLFERAEVGRHLLSLMREPTLQY